jgi:hypothetical protein
MDRRNFFKRFGSVAVVPFVPFKWKRPKEEIIDIKGPVYDYKDIDIKKARKRIKEKKIANGTYTHSITIDGRDCTNLCTSIEVNQEAEYIDLTSLEDRDNLRHLHPSFHKSYIRATFYLTYDDFWRRFDPASNNWHHVEIANRPVGVIYSSKTVLTRMDQSVVVGDVVKLNLEFASVGPINVIATKRV